LTMAAAFGGTVGTAVGAATVGTGGRVASGREVAVGTGVSTRVLKGETGVLAGGTTGSVGVGGAGGVAQEAATASNSDRARALRYLLFILYLSGGLVCLPATIPR